MPEKNISLSSLWEKRLEDWMDSHLSPVLWCQKNQLSISQFYYWRKRLLSPSPRPKATFVELKEEKSEEPSLFLKWDFLELHLSKDFDALCLERCLKVMKSLSCLA